MTPAGVRASIAYAALADSPTDSALDLGLSMNPTPEVADWLVGQVCAMSPCRFASVQAGSVTTTCLSQFDEMADLVEVRYLAAASQTANLALSALFRRAGLKVTSAIRDPEVRSLLDRSPIVMVPAVAHGLEVKHDRTALQASGVNMDALIADAQEGLEVELNTLSVQALHSAALLSEWLTGSEPPADLFDPALPTAAISASFAESARSALVSGTEPRMAEGAVLASSRALWPEGDIGLAAVANEMARLSTPASDCLMAVDAGRASLSRQLTFRCGTPHPHHSEMCGLVVNSESWDQARIRPVEVDGDILTPPSIEGWRPGDVAGCSCRYSPKSVLVFGP